MDELYDDIYQTLDEFSQHIPHNSPPPFVDPLASPHVDPSPPPHVNSPPPPPPSPPTPIGIDEKQNLRDSTTYDINQLKEKMHNIKSIHNSPSYVIQSASLMQTIVEC